MRLLLLAAGVFSVANFGIALAPWAVLTFMLLIVNGYAGQTVNASANTMLQLGAPDDLRGRVMGVYTMFFAGMSPIGALFTGLLASTAGIRPTIAVEAGLCLCSVVVALLFGRLKPAGV